MCEVAGLVVVNEKSKELVTFVRWLQCSICVPTLDAALLYLDFSVL